MWLILFSPVADGQIAMPSGTAVLTTLVVFDGSNGGAPERSLIQGSDGSLYGTTPSGGDYGHGTVFKLSSSGTLTTLYSFCSQTNCTDGADPSAGLIEGSDGNFYGTTPSGGEHSAMGTVFRITPNGTLATLYSFCTRPACSDGAQPYAGLVQDLDGSLYGTTEFGGVTAQGINQGWGTVFKISPQGVLTTLYRFCTQVLCLDGGYPNELVRSNDGSLYGTSWTGGTHKVGTVFKITVNGTFTNLYSFCSQNGCADGSDPSAPLIQARDGNLYGTTVVGGNKGAGTAFKITPTGVLTTVYEFCSQTDCTDGSNPYGKLIQDVDGSFYGTTFFGGDPLEYGTIFRISPSGAFNTIYAFTNTDGSNPAAGLLKGRNGVFYGTTKWGAYGWGTVFAMHVLNPCLRCAP
jgi:uncharacterized repeat protein (TIGR03803 family)